MTKPTVIAISHRALKGRINRALVDKHQQLRADRRGGVTQHLLIDTRSRTVIATDVDIDKLARKLGVLQPWETAPPR
jgi:hypothetical protein